MFAKIPPIRDYITGIQTRKKKQMSKEDVEDQENGKTVKTTDPVIKFKYLITLILILGFRLSKCLGSILLGLGSTRWVYCCHNSDSCSYTQKLHGASSIPEIFKWTFP